MASQLFQIASDAAAMAHWPATAHDSMRGYALNPLSRNVL